MKRTLQRAVWFIGGCVAAYGIITIVAGTLALKIGRGDPALLGGSRMNRRARRAAAKVQSKSVNAAVERGQSRIAEANGAVARSRDMFSLAQQALQLAAQDSPSPTASTTSARPPSR